MAFLKVKNRAFSTLASGVSDVATEWTVATGEGALFPTTGDFHVTCEDEIVKCTSRTGDVLTVTRAQEGTAAAAHTAGKAVELRVTAGVIENIQSEHNTHKDLTTGVHGAGANTILHSGSTDVIGGAQLTQVFGASAGRLSNLIVTPIDGEFLRVLNAGASAFSGVINGSPSATSVVYDGESNENNLNGISSGATYWGRIILHNTTRGNSRKIVSVDVGTNTITTESSTDDWANNDVITCQSQTNTQAGYFDVDLSAEVAATTVAIFMFATCKDEESNYDANRYVTYHPYESYNVGKRQWILANLADEQNSATFPLKVVSQKITMFFGSGCVDVITTSAVKASLEYADT